MPIRRYTKNNEDDKFDISEEINKMSPEELKEYLNYIISHRLYPAESSYKNWKDSLRAKEWVARVVIRYCSAVNEPKDDGMDLRDFLDLVANFIIQYEMDYEDEGYNNTYQELKKYILEMI